MFYYVVVLYRVDLIGMPILRSYIYTYNSRCPSPPPPHPEQLAAPPARRESSCSRCPHLGARHARLACAAAVPLGRSATGRVRLDQLEHHPTRVQPSCQAPPNCFASERARTNRSGSARVVTLRASLTRVCAALPPRARCDLCLCHAAYW